MRKRISIGAGAAVAGILTHGVVHAAVNLADLQPAATYRGFCQHQVFAIWSLWSHAHGWEPSSHVLEFSHFLVRLVTIVFPLIGFALFWSGSRPRDAKKLWRPMAIAITLLALPHFVVMAPFSALGLDAVWEETARTVVTVLLMVWCVGGIQISWRPQYLRGAVRATELPLS